MSGPNWETGYLLEGKLDAYSRPFPQTIWECNLRRTQQTVSLYSWFRPLDRFRSNLLLKSTGITRLCPNPVTLSA